MKLSLYQRLSFALSFVFIAVASVFYFWSQQVTEQLRMQSQQTLHLSLAANLARDNPLLQQGVYDQDALENLFHTLMVLGPAFEFYFLNPKGDILTYSADNSLIKKQKINVTPILNLIQNQVPLPILGDDPRHLTRQKIFSAAPVFNGSKLQGYLYVIVAGEQYDSVFNSTQLNHHFKMYFVLAGATLFFLFVLMLGLFRYVTNPVRRLHKDMQNFIDNKFNHHKVDLSRWQDHDSNEINQVGSMFAQLVDKIGKQIDLLNKTDHQRRELLAHLSHDLRTPLASIQGYVETLYLNNDTLPTDKKIQFLQTVLRNSKHLNHLIDQIFELAHIETGQVSVELEPFNLAELLYDVIAKFSLTSKQRSIEIVVIPKECHEQVYCDIAKLDRVLTNLLENAIRHSPNNSKIEFKIERINSKLCNLTIIDRGTGIKADELPYIFDPRYRASNAINDKSLHTGLGLAISKRLLTMMNIEIEVFSELGHGCQFTLQLPKNLS